MNNNCYLEEYKKNNVIINEQDEFDRSKRNKNYSGDEEYQLKPSFEGLEVYLNR